MFCYKCGASVVPGSKFCASCGAVMQADDVPAKVENDAPAQAPSASDAGVGSSEASAQSDAFPRAQQYQPEQSSFQPAQDPSQSSYTPEGQPFQSGNQPYPPFQPSSPPEKSGSGKGLWWKIAIPVVAVLGIAVGLFFFVFNNSPAVTVAKSLSNISNELEQRVHDTPLESIGILMDCLESGTVSANFNYSDSWSSTRGIVKLHSDEKRGEAVVEAEIRSDDIDLDIDVYVNREHAAMRVSQIDNNYYGITYDTFRDDFRSFANLLDLSRDEVNMIGDIVDMYANLMNMGDDEIFEGYQEILEDFIKNADVSSERVEINSGGDSVSVNKIEFTITAEMLVGLLEDLIDELENDENMRGMYDASIEAQSGMYGYFPGPTYDEIIRETRSELRDMSRNLSGDIIIGFYIGSSNRLVRLEVNADIEYDRERGELEFSLDFGSSAKDLWVLEMNTYDDYSNSYFKIEWEMNESSRGGGETVLRTITDQGWGVYETSLILHWTDRGLFTFSVVSDWDSLDIFSGTYDKTSDGFSLIVDDPFVNSYWGESLMLDISAERRSNHIDDITFINVSEWDQSLIDKIEEFFGFGGYYDPMPMPMPVPPVDDGIDVTEAPPPVATPTDPALANSDLLGMWSFSHGRGTYFFWESPYVHFEDNGYVMTGDENGDIWEIGVWSVDGNRLTVTDNSGDGFTYEYTFELHRGMLSITDSDFDTGHFEIRW